jgi:hypothetical protein
MEKKNQSNILKDRNDFETVGDDATDEEIVAYYTYHIDNPCEAPDGKGNARFEWIQLAKNLLKNHGIKNPVEEKRLKNCIEKYEPEGKNN